MRPPAALKGRARVFPTTSTVPLNTPPSLVVSVRLSVVSVLTAGLYGSSSVLSVVTTLVCVAHPTIREQKNKDKSKFDLWRISHLLILNSFVREEGLRPLLSYNLDPQVIPCRFHESACLGCGLAS